MKKYVSIGYALAVWTGLGLAAPARAQAPKEPVEETVVGHVLHPAGLDPTPDRLATLRMPPGFRIEKFAEGLENPRMLLVTPDGTVYVSQRRTKNVVMLRSLPGSRKADVQMEVAKGPHMHGLALRDGKMYLYGVHDVWTADVRPDGTLSEKTQIIGDLPDAGQHEDRTLAFGPDGRLYLSVGSTNNTANEPNPENATILVASPDGRSRKIFASGLRNTIGFDWNPVTHELYGMDMGIDWQGDDHQREELNHIQEGKRYGWPYVYENGIFDPQHLPQEKNYTLDEWRKESKDPDLTYTAHASPIGFLFYTGAQFPAEYRDDAFVAFHGSWNRAIPSGYEVVRVHFDPSGKPVSMTPFVTGFVTNKGGKWGQFGRPCGLAQMPDGSLLVSDDTEGVIYRVSYGASAPPDVLDRVATDVLSSRLLGGPAALRAASPDFGEGGTIPENNADYGGKVSPALSLPAFPSAGVRSLVLMMEDPDAQAPKPFVHWLITLPARTLTVPEGVSKTGQPAEVAGAVQGSNSTGTVGYYGPHPPVGDPPHHYHFQVFALDTALNLPPGFTRTAALRAMNGHVLARAEVVGLYSKP